VSVFVLAAASEELVQVVQQLTVAEQKHCNTIAALSSQVGQLKAQHMGVVSVVHECMLVTS
jgi:hypothetical protein